MRWLQSSTFGLFLTVLAMMGSARLASGEVIFEENFAARPTGAGTFGSSPNVTNVGGGVYSQGPNLAQATQGTIGHFGDPSLGIKGLRFQPMDPEGTPSGEQKAGSYGQTMYVPYQYEFGTEAIRLTLVARQPAAWNNFVFGFSDTDGNISNMLLLKENPGGMNPARDQMQLFHNGAMYQRNIPAGIDTNYFRELVLEYDPNKANTPDVNPYTFKVDGAEIPMSTAAVNLPAMTTTGGVGPSSIQGVSWGFWFADGNIDRSVLIQSMKFEIFTPEPENDPGDFDGDGVVDGADFLVWQRGESPNGLTDGDLQLWKDNLVAGSAAAAAAVPEPASVVLLAMGSAAAIGAKRRRFN
jgi:hypothetical protein